VAGYDDYFLRHVLALPRDRAGRLVRGEQLPPGVEVDEDGMRVVRNPVPFARMFRQVKERQGYDEERARYAWHDWLLDNPRFGKGGEDRARG
jgi:hypothetical protein